MRIKVSEIFSSIQGEGPSMGRNAVFLRLQGCNLLCGGAWTCDTIETWRQGNPMEIDELWAELENYPGSLLVITGGEPLLQESAVMEIVRENTIFDQIEIETNGTKLPLNIVKQNNVFYNVSPKLSNSGIEWKKRIKPGAIAAHAACPRSIFKFVVASEQDIHEAVLHFVTQHEIDASRVWLMPAAGSREELRSREREIANLAVSFGFNFSSRLHMEIYDQAVGV